MIHDYLRSNIIITDGAMGTYYSEITGDNTNFCEFANINNPEAIKRIHKEYIEAGARLIRTNTFSANTISLNTSREIVKDIIEKGVSIASEAAKGKEIFVAASIGPVNTQKSENKNTNILEEYLYIIDVFLNCGIKIFIFETFSSLEFLKELSEFIKEKSSDAFILTQFAITPDGYTREGIGITRIVKQVKAVKTIDAYGFNCGSGPTHLLNSVKRINIFEDILSVLPNAGYPEIVNGRTVYVNNPDYFSQKMEKVKAAGVKILGGCCGTTPAHIKKLSERLNAEIPAAVTDIGTEEKALFERNVNTNSFKEKLKRNEFVVAVELDPPFDTSIEKIMNGARICKENGVDLVTVADSPMSRVRVDSIAVAAKIKREVGIETMPHICCRDKNTNAIRSGLLASHIEGIRNILAVTGDPVAEADRTGIKSVFNLNSFKLIELISEMNKDVFADENLLIGGALNFNVLNKNQEFERMQKKVQKGASFFLTQPVFDDEVIDFLSKMKKDKNIKILGGIIPITSYTNAQFLNNEIPGMHIPDVYLKRFSKEMTRAEAEEAGINLAVEIANKIKKYVDGIYLITPFNRFEMVMKIYNQIKN